MSYSYSTAPDRTSTFTVKIIEQPCITDKPRYESENRATKIFGRISPQSKTFFTVEIEGYKGRVTVVVLCITEDTSHECQLYKLIGPNCQNGCFSCNYNITEKTYKIEFRNLSFNCLKKRDLKNRTNKNNGDKKIDSKIPRLYVEVIPKDRNIRPVYVVSDPIDYKQKVPDLAILKLSHHKICVDRNQEEIILLCKKVPKHDVRIRFVEMKKGRKVWEAYGIFNSNGVYNGTAICFRPPEYYNKYITAPVKVFIQLEKISNNDVSRPHDFFYLPAAPDTQHLRSVETSHLSLNNSNDIVGVVNDFHNEQTFSPTSPFLSFNNNSHIAGVTNNFQSSSSFETSDVTGIQQTYAIEEIQNDRWLLKDNLLNLPPTADTQDVSAVQTTYSHPSFNESDDINSHFAGVSNNFHFNSSFTGDPSIQPTHAIEEIYNDLSFCSAFNSLHEFLL